MDRNDTRIIENFIKGIEQAGDLIRQKKPDCIVAPMFGAVPFIDILNVIQDDFPNEIVEYVPASNKVHDVRNVIHGAMNSILEKYYNPEGTKIVSIDEVVSGNSLMRVYKQFNSARQSFADRKTIEVFGQDTSFENENIRAYRDNIKDKITYFSVGIIDSKLSRIRKQKNPEYLELLSKNIVLPVEVDSIITMDRPAFFPAKYKTAKNSEGRTMYLPVVDNFDINKSYVDLLIHVAEIYGKDMSSANPKNLVKIRESYKLIPEKYRGATGI